MAEGDGANGANTMNCYGCATVAVGHSSRRPVATGGAWSRASGPPSQVRRQVCDIPHGSGSQIAAQQQWRNERTSGETADGDRPVVHNAVTGSMFGWLSHRARCVVGAIPFFFCLCGTLGAPGFQKAGRKDTGKEFRKESRKASRKEARKPPGKEITDSF